ncbi:MAG: hypothetical protein QM765_52565 [Myxococcales bacterium]
MRVALVLSLALALCLPAPVRAEGMLKKTRLLDVTLRADEGGGGAPPAATAATPVEARPARRGVGWALLPFGIGQYANGEPVKGALICISEILLFATSAAALGIVESSKVESYGFMNGGKVQDPDIGKALVITYMTAFWVGVAVVGIGIIDALVYRPSETTTVALAPTGVAVKF